MSGDQTAAVDELTRRANEIAEREVVHYRERTVG